jgi:hypothetical protein
MLRRVIAIGLGAYLGAGLATRAMEGNGLLTCSCRSDCWCHRPGLSVFRWVFPYGHSLPEAT